MNENLIRPSNSNANQLQDTVNSYRALIAASGIGAWEYDINTGYLNCNDIYFAMLGITVEGHSAKHDLENAWINLLHPDDSVAAQEKFRDFIEGKNLENYENFFRLKSNLKEWIWIWSRGKILKDSHGKPERAIGTHLDVTAQKEAELDIRRERLLLRTLIDNLPDTIYVKDDCGRKVIANIADVRSIGALSEGNVLGKTDLQLFKDEIVAKRGYQDDLIVLQTGQPILNKEECFSENDNRVKWLQTSKIPVCDENGKVIQLLGIGHDITQRKAKDEAIQLLNLELKSQAENLMLLNEQLNVRKEQELEKALAQGKFEIASEVLHDIGNALVGFGSHLTRLTKLSGQDFTTPIQNLSAFLSAQSPKLTDLFGAAKSVALTDLAINLSANQQKYSAEIRSAVRELVHIISHVKEILNIQRQFVRGQEGKHERKPVNLLRLVEDCKAMLGANYERKEIEFVLTTELETYFFDGDATKIMQVLLNIQKNAIEAIPIHAKEKKICLVLKKTLNWIELELTDSGIGFDLATGEHLFERGFTTKENGTGLGLFNCRSIIESHNGSLTIASDGPQRGTTVLIQLPCNWQFDQ